MKVTSQTLAALGDANLLHGEELADIRPQPVTITVAS
jgi:hypothetical protein